MYENDTISYKVYLKYSESPDDLEVRRFAIDKEDCPKLPNLLAKLLVVFPGLQNEDFTINWHDNANNLVTINSDDDLGMALSIMVGPLFKLCILARGKQKKEQQQQQQKPQRHDHHIETHQLHSPPTNHFQIHMPPPPPPPLQFSDMPPPPPLQFPDISSLLQSSLHASIAGQAACNAFAAATNARASISSQAALVSLQNTFMAASNAHAAASMSSMHQGSLQPVVCTSYPQLSWSHQMPVHQGSHINNLDRFVSDSIAVGNMNIGTSSMPRLGHPGVPLQPYMGSLGLGMGGQRPGGFKVNEVTQNLETMNLER